MRAEDVREPRGAAAEVHPGKVRPVGEQPQQGVDAHPLRRVGVVAAGEQAAVGEDRYQRGGAALVHLPRAEALAARQTEVVRDAAKLGLLALESVGVEDAGDLVGETFGVGVAHGGVGPQPDLAVAHRVLEVQCRQAALASDGPHGGGQVQAPGRLVRGEALDAPHQTLFLRLVEQDDAFRIGGAQEGLGRTPWPRQA